MDHPLQFANAEARCVEFLLLSLTFVASVGLALVAAYGALALLLGLMQRAVTRAVRAA